MLNKLNKKIPQKRDKSDKKQINNNKSIQKKSLNPTNKINKIEFQFQQTQKQNIFKPIFKSLNPLQNQSLQTFFNQVQIIKILPNEQAKFDQFKYLLQKQHPNIIRVFNIQKNEEQNFHIGLVQDWSKYSQLKQISEYSLNQKIKIIVQILNAISHMHNKNFFFLYMNTSNFRINKKNKRILLNPFYKDKLSEQSYLWNSIIAPQIINQKLNQKQINYFKCDIWSIANIIVQIIYGVTYRIYYSKKIQQKNYLFDEQNQEKIPKFPKLKLNDDQDLQKILIDSLNFRPSKRPELIKLINIFKKLQKQVIKKYSKIDEIVQIMYKTISIFNQKNLTFQTQLLDKKNYKFAYQSIQKFLKLRITNIQIIYKASQFKFSAQIFHHYCDRIPNVLLIAKSNQNKIFGGFTTEGWDISNQNGIFGNYISSKSIILSFTNQTVHRLKNKQKAIGNNINFGPIFGLADIIINNYNIASVCHFPLCYRVDQQSKTKDNISLVGGYNFFLEEYQIFKISLK